MIIIICGKSSSGKDSLFKELSKHYTPLISTTSRPMREGEVNGREYNFISREEFEKGISENKFIEHREYHTLVNNIPDTWYYGLKKEPLNFTKDYIVILDLQGAQALKKAYNKDKIITFYIDAEDNKRTEWAQSRGSFDPTEWNRRFKDDEIKFSSDKVADVCDYILKNDGTLEDLKIKFQKIVLDISFDVC